MKNILVALGVLAVVAVIGAALYEQFDKPRISDAPLVSSSAPGGTPGGTTGNAAAVLQVRPTDIFIGQPDAKVTVIEYASLTCPHCAHFHNDVLGAVKTKYVDTGKVRIVFRDFPLDGLALRAAMLPHCAGPLRYFGVLGTLFSRQQQWATNPDPLSALGAIARQAGMSEDTFKTCIADKSVENLVLQSQLEANKVLGVNSTPTFFINGTKYAGALEIDQFAGIVDPLLGATN